MTDKINELLRRVEEFNPKAAAEIEEFRIKILGKKGELNALMEDFKTVAPELKRELGQQLNKLKTTALDRINSLREQLQDAASDDGAATEDMTRPGSAEQLGSRHPISLVKNQIVEVFSRLSMPHLRQSRSLLRTYICDAGSSPTSTAARQGLRLIAAASLFTSSQSFSASFFPSIKTPIFLVAPWRTPYTFIA